MATRYIKLKNGNNVQIPSILNEYLEYYRFNSSFGTYVYILSSCTVEILGRMSNGEYLAYIDVNLMRNDEGTTSSQFTLGSITSLLPSNVRVNLTTNILIPLTTFPSNFNAEFSGMANINTNGDIEIGRIYNAEGSYGAWPLTEVKQGHYHFCTVLPVTLN